MREDKKYMNLHEHSFMNEFDKAMNELDEKYLFLSSTNQIVSSTNEEDKVIVFERGDLVFVFNFHPENTYDGYKIGCDLPGKFRVALDSDSQQFGGQGRVGHDVDHFTSPEGIPGVAETNFNNRPNSFKVLSPARTCVAYYRVDESQEANSGGNPGEEIDETLKADAVDNPELSEQVAGQILAADTMAKKDDLEEVISKESAAGVIATQEEVEEPDDSKIDGDVGPTIERDVEEEEYEEIGEWEFND